MSMVTVSTRRKRTYIRKFDHDRARAMRLEGYSYSELAEYFGVSTTAVQRVCEPAANIRMTANTEKYYRRHRKICPGCGGLVGATLRKDTSGYCYQCWNKRRLAQRVREDTLLCSTCKEWKPDKAFYPADAHPGRRYRTYRCRECEKKSRRERYRTKGI